VASFVAIAVCLAAGIVVLVIAARLERQPGVDAAGEWQRPQLLRKHVRRESSPGQEAA
jgi:hypothetical protein